MKYWPKEAYKWYSKACIKYDYPALPYGKAIKALLEKTDTVLDLGCGIGAASIMISPWCKHIIALDQDENALYLLKTHAKENSVLNIETIHESWPLSMPIQVDIIIALHVYGVMRSLDNLKLVFESANKGGFIACNAVCCRDDEPFIKLKEELGIAFNHEKCDNGCYIKGVLEALGADVKCLKAVYEFGQPLDTMEEVISFISWQVGADDNMRHIVEKYVDCYAIKKDDGFLIPIKRKSCGITFLKQ
jgi:precorrin-6B methylase 2